MNNDNTPLENDVADAVSAMEDRSYAGTYKSLADYAREHFREETKDIPELHADHINYASIGRVLEQHGVISTRRTRAGEIMVFKNTSNKKDN